MVDLERLKVRGARAYEVGRARTAMRIAFVLLPMIGLCLLTTRDRETCACLAVPLFVIAVWLRWRDRRGTEDVTTGVLAGSIPLVTGLLLSTGAPVCQGLRCLAVAAIAGVGAGVWLALRERRAGSPLTSWLTAAGIAILVASLGCASLGALAVGGVVIGIAFGGGAGALALRAR